MTSFLPTVRTLALRLALTAALALCVTGPHPAAAAATNSVSSLASTPSPTPIGGPQLAGRGVIVNLAPGVPRPPKMPGASFLLADMTTGQILVAKAPHAPHSPASTLKTLTALTLIPILDPNAKIMVTPQDVAVDGSLLGIVPGTAYRVGTLFQGLLMVSGNDAAFALARGNHSVAVTLAAMNANAARLNAFDTVAKDPSGLDKPGQRTSAYDLALIGRAAMQLPDFRRYVRARQSSMPGGRSREGRWKPGFKIGSHNKLLYNYPGAIGIKTGFTDASQHTFVGAATRGGRTYLVTEMASRDGSWRPTAALLNWAFAHGRSLTPIGQLVEPGEPAVSTQPGAKTSVALAPSRPGTASASEPLFPARIGMAGGLVAMAGVCAAIWARRRTISARRR